MNQLTAHKEQYTRNEADLYLAFELGKKEWKLGFSVGFGQKPRERTIVAGNLAAVRAEINLAKRRFGLPKEARVLSWCERPVCTSWSSLKNRQLDGAAHPGVSQTALGRITALGVWQKETSTDRRLFEANKGPTSQGSH